MYSIISSKCATPQFHSQYNWNGMAVRALGIDANVGVFD